ncbi:hypothetical protein [Streptomyces mirabilis]|uniref:hypothetical protein n=1 Tax=Streptomyces mirabilis TaxID=68239 RepID=UPI003660699A
MDQYPRRKPNSGSRRRRRSGQVGEGEGGQPKRLPYDDAPFVVHHLDRKMTSADFVLGTRVRMAVLRDQHPEEYRELLLELSQQEQQPA